MHEQGASTQEITRNVRSAAAGAGSMSTHVTHVESAVHETGSNVELVVHLAHELDADGRENARPRGGIRHHRSRRIGGVGGETGGGAGTGGMSEAGAG